MLNFNQFPPPPSIDSVTACESDGRLKALDSSEAAFTIAQWLGSSNVEIVIGQESARPAQSKYEAKEAFTAHTETMLQRLTASYYEEGVFAVVKQLSTETDGVPSVVNNFASAIVRLFNSVLRTKQYLPFLYSKQPILSHSVSVNVGIVSRICWHPHTKTLAVVFADDTIRIFGSGQTLTPLLKHRMQKNITDIQWMPYYISILAVGCSSGILLWTLDPVSVVARPSGSSLTHLKHSQLTPVFSLSYHPKGLYFACVGGEGRELVIYDALTDLHQTVFSGLLTSLTKVLWSPDGSKLLVAMRSNAIRVFETKTWSSERWSLQHPLQSAAWSSCGQCLLFSTAGQATIFALSFTPTSEGMVSGSRMAMQVADFSRHVVTSVDGEEVSVGGQINQLCWDPTSERLAVVFEECEYVCLMHAIVSPQLHVAPGGFIKGCLGQLPVYAQFQNGVSNGAILSIVWSDGKVSHLPLRYTPRSTVIHKNQHQQLHNRSISNTTLNHTLNHTVSLHHTSFHRNLLGHQYSTPIGREDGRTNISLFTSPITSPITGSLFTSPS